MEGCKAADPEKQTTKLLESLRNLSNALSNQRTMLEDINNRNFGQLPADPPADNIAGADNVFLHINSLLSECHVLANSIEREINRLNENI